MFFVRGKSDHPLCPKCKCHNGTYAKCRCQLKDPKSSSCDCGDEEIRKQYKKTAFFYVYVLEVDWSKDRHEDIDVIADIKLDDNPFIHCVVSIYDKYYNLGKAEAIEIRGPMWRAYHVTKSGTPVEWCYCENLPWDAEDFK